MPTMTTIGHARAGSLIASQSSPAATRFFYFFAFLILLASVDLIASYTPLTKLPPHAGYHGGTAQRGQPFFEGWYLRIIDPKEQSSSVSLIHHVMDPHERTSRRGVGLQIVTSSSSSSSVQNRRIVVESSDVFRFQAKSHELEIGNLFRGQGDFFELSMKHAKGQIVTKDSVRVTWNLTLQPLIGWGGDETKQQYSTAGWLAAFPIFEPLYQILVSHGLVNGVVTVENIVTGDMLDYYQFNQATMYLEKNWGGSFPSRWWWMQANDFFEGSGDLCVTATGGRRRVPLISNNNDEEEVGLIGLHWNGKFLPFPTVKWLVRWGDWRIEGHYEDYKVILTGSCKDEGAFIACPTPLGMQDTALETFSGTLCVELYQNDKLILNEASRQACLETGGLPWNTPVWKGESAMTEPIKSIAFNMEVEHAASRMLGRVSQFVDIPGL